MKTTAEIQIELILLRNELKAINSRNSEIDEIKNNLDIEQAKLKERKKVIAGYDEWRWRNDGLIDVLKLELLESQSPIYDNVSGRIRRIIGVDKKWIELKCDGKDTEASTKHNRETGWIMRARNDSGAIDVQKALDIWGGHLAKR